MITERDIQISKWDHWNGTKNIQNHCDNIENIFFTELTFF